MTMETANLMLSEMRAANNRRSQLIDLQRNSAILPSQIQTQGLRDTGFYNNSSAASGAEISLPSAMSPRSSTTSQPPARPFSANFDSPSYQSISAIFGTSDASLNKRFSQPLAARKVSRRPHMHSSTDLMLVGVGYACPVEPSGRTR
jgi:hypothetical protein